MARKFMKNIIRYTLEKMENKYIGTKDLKGIINFGANGRILSEGQFFSTNDFKYAKDVRDYLALTFTPKYKYTFSLLDNSGYSLQNPYARFFPSRVWPSFGHHGGGCEIVLIEGRLKWEENNSEYPPPEGGQLDEYHQDNTKKDEILESLLIIVVFDALKFKEVFAVQNDEITGGPRNLGIKMVTGLGVSYKWYKGLNYSISCAYKPQNEKIILKFWGYIWEDYLGKRYLLKHPVEVVYDEWNYTYENLVKLIQLKKDKSLRETIQKIITNIYDELGALANKFDRNDRDTIDIIDLWPTCSFTKCKMCDKPAITMHSIISPGYYRPYEFPACEEHTKVIG